MDENRRSSIFDKTAVGAVDYAIHQKHTAPRRIATIDHAHARRFMAEDYGITVELADELRELMIEAADRARAGAGDAANDRTHRILSDLEALNQHVDSLRLAQLIASYRKRMSED